MIYVAGTYENIKKYVIQKIISSLGAAETFYNFGDDRI